MAVQENTADAERAQAEAILAEVELLPEVREMRCEFMESSGGDPALKIVGVLKSKLALNEHEIKKIAGFISTVQMKLIHSGITRFPYPEVEQAQ